MFTTALAFLSFMVLNISYSVGYNVYASLTTSNSNTMDTTTMEMKRGNIAMGFNQNKIKSYSVLTLLCKSFIKIRFCALFPSSKTVILRGLSI